MKKPPLNATMEKSLPPGRRPKPAAHWRRQNTPDIPICGRPLLPSHSFAEQIREVTCGSCLHIISKVKIHYASARSKSGTLCGEISLLEAPTDNPACVACAKCKRILERQIDGHGVTHMRDASGRKSVCGISVHSTKGRIRTTTAKWIVSCTTCLNIMREQKEDDQDKKLLLGFRGTVPRGWEEVLDYYPPGAYVPVNVLMERLPDPAPIIAWKAKQSGLKFEEFFGAMCLRLPE